MKNIKEGVLKEEKCVVCSKTYGRRVVVRQTRKYKKGRDNHATRTCSSKCSRIYEGIRKHFNYKLTVYKESFLVEVGKVIDETRDKTSDELYPMIAKTKDKTEKKVLSFMFELTLRKLEELKTKLGIK